MLYQYLATASGNLAAIASGMHFGWPSPSLPQLLSKESPINITSSDGSWIAVMPCVGGPFGALLSGLLVDRIGRKKFLLTVSPFYFLAWIAIAYTPSLFIIHISRFVVGIMDGIAFTVLPMYIGEIADYRIRGLLCCSVSVAFVFGFFLINVLGLYFSIKTTALIASLLPIMHFATFIWMPESPYHYLLKQRDIKAAACLKKLTGNVNADAAVLKLSSEYRTNATGLKRHLNLFTEKSNRKALIIVVGLRCVQQFSGNYTIAFYCLTIFNEAGGFISARTATLLYFLVQLLGGTLSSVLVDKAGRKPLLLISIIGSGVALTIQGLYFYFKQESKMDLSRYGFLPVVTLLLYNILFNIGLSSIPILILGELFPTDVKAFALCLVDIIYSGVIVAAAKFFQIMNDQFGMYVPFFVFALCCALGLVFIACCVFETKGKTLAEIQNEMRGVISVPNKSQDTELKSVLLPTN